MFRTIISFSFSFIFLGFALKWVPQQGQNMPSQFMKISHKLHRFCPTPYLVSGRRGLTALYLWQTPLQDMIKWLQMHDLMNLGCENCNAAWNIFKIFKNILWNFHWSPYKSIDMLIIVNLILITEQVHLYPLSSKYSKGNQTGFCMDYVLFSNSVCDKCRD